MSRTPDPRAEQRRANVIKAYQDNPKLSYADIGAQFGMSSAYVYHILYNAGVLPIGQRKPRQPRGERAVKSATHRMIGVLMENHVGELILSGELPPDADKTAIAGKINMTPQMYEDGRLGVLDFTLLQLGVIAKWMGMSVEEMLRKANKMAQAYGAN